LSGALGIYQIEIDTYEPAALTLKLNFMVTLFIGILGEE